MKKINQLFFIVVVLITFLYNIPNVMAEPLKIVTTIGQITDVVRNVGGQHVRVVGLMGAGVDPHLYKASESDVRKLSEADVVFYNGLNLEAKLDAIFQRMKRTRKVVAVTDPVKRDYLLDSLDYKGHYDPHVWFDVVLWKQTVEQVRDTLSEVDQEHSQDYQLNAEQYLAELDKLHAYVESRVNEIPQLQRVLVTAHDAFRYFGRKYMFEVVGLQGISTESQAGTADVIRLADFIVRRQIRAIFVESSVPERNVKAVIEAVKSRNWDVKIGGELYSDAMGDDDTFEGTYIGMQTHNIDTIIDALKGE